MKIQHDKSMPAIWMMAIVLALGFALSTPHVSKAADPESPPAAAPPQDAVPLRWSFRVGDTFHVQERAITTATDGLDNKYRNEVQVEYVWQVADVAPDGSATLVVTPKRVVIHSELPPGRFDSARDDPTLEPNEEMTWRRPFFEARAWVNAQFKCEVTDEGRVGRVWGAVPVAEMFAPLGFTPGDFITLPEKRVQTGDSWEVEFSETNGANRQGSAKYWLVDCEWHTGRPIYHIEGTMTYAQHRNWPGSQSEFGPMISVSHFDPTAGRFLDQVNVTSGQVRIGPNEIMTVKVGTMRRLTALSESPATQARNGEYLFAGIGDQMRPVQLAGIQTRTETGEAPRGPKELRIAFHHGWEDANRDSIPDATELTDVTTRFREGEPVQALLSVTEMADCRMHVDVLDSQGQKLSTTDLPLTAGPVPHAWLHQEQLPAGVYFFEWYANDRYLVRVPVQVFSESEVRAAKAADFTAIETSLPVHVQVVVTVAQASIYANQTVIDTVPMGTHLVASKVRDQWLFVERADKSGWIHGADVALSVDEAK